MKASLALLVLAFCLQKCTAAERSSAAGENRGEERARYAAAKCNDGADVLACKSAPVERDKVGVLLLNLGGPEAVGDVQPFLYNLFSDPDIIRLPWFLSPLQKPLAFVISKARAGRSQEAYKRIGGGSPIGAYTRQQAQILEQKLREQGLDARCYIAMRYWHPLTAEAVTEIQQDGVGRLVVLPLYPQYSISTTGSSLRELAKHLPSQLAATTTVVPFWYDRPGYIGAVSELIRKELVKFSAEERSQGVHVLFSAHGVPKFYVEREGDVYQRHMEDCVERIAAELPSDVKVHLSYQSKVGPVEWLKPYTDSKIEELADAGVKSLVVVPISFVSEHIETLDEIDHEYRELALERGVKHWERVAALNLDERFLTELSHVVLDAWDSQSLLSIEEALIKMDTRGPEAATRASAAGAAPWKPVLVLLATFVVSVLVAVWSRWKNDEGAARKKID